VLRGRVQLRSEAPGRLHRRARGTHTISKRLVGCDHTDRTGLGAGEDATDDLIVGRVPTRAWRARDLDNSRRDRRRRRPLEHDRDLLPAPGGPALELADEADHRRVPVPPPPVRARADHVHPIHKPPHRRTAYEPLLLPRKRVRDDPSSAAQVVTLPHSPDGRSGVAWLATLGAPHRPAEARRADHRAARSRSKGGLSLAGIPGASDPLVCCSAVHSAAPRCPIEGCDLCRLCLAANCDEVVISAEVIAPVRTP
jgi:hypothetical protein